MTYANEPSFVNKGRVMRYQVIESSSAESLSRQVNEAIAAGWEPLGGHFVQPHIEGRSYSRFSQAMTHPAIPPSDQTTAPSDADGGYGYPKAE